MSTQRAQPLAWKTTALATEPLPLPFFEDFTIYSQFPDSTKWIDDQVYINSTMGYKPVSRGVATFDALDWRGIPYDSFSNTAFRYADSLTSQPINMSLDVITPGDSVYLSFFYQPQGNGFYPLPQDSLILYLKTRFGGFVKVWSTPGTALKPFQQVMIPIYDSLYFDSFFQFRFVNIGAMYWADAVWNVDYIRLHGGRNMYDTAVNDIGYVSDPSFMLNDYTSMPYRQFMAYPPLERATQYVCSLRNNYEISQTFNFGYTATAVYTGTILRPLVFFPDTVAALTTKQQSFPYYTTTVPLSTVGNYGKVLFQHKHFIESVSATDPHDNDSAIRNNFFDNYFAYDDGSAEKSYFLTLYPTLPGKIAIEHHLNTPDTMRGMAIYFGRQVPFPFYKTFNINVYSALRGVNGSSSDVLIYTQEACSPGYAERINDFYVYKFDNPVPMNTGLYFAGTTQPAESGSDTLYFGLDVNRRGPNHAYYNLLNSWAPSLISGAIMMRPIFGEPITGSGVEELGISRRKWTITPNPAHDVLHVVYEGDAKGEYAITDLQGRQVMSGTTRNNEQTLDISGLAAGMYLVRFSSGDQVFDTQKFIKLQ